MRNFQDKRLFIGAFSIRMTVPLNKAAGWRTLTLLKRD